MVWDERQAAMLAEMGIRVWQSPAAPAPAPAVATPVADADTPRAPSGVAEPAPATPRAVAAELGARPGGVEAMDWADLRTAVAGCTACGLCRSRTNTVFGVGYTQAHWMVVGEAPGEQEDRQGEPFVGKAGQLLDNMLRALGLTRQADGEGLQPAQQVYIANVLKCRPPMNRNPQPEEVEQCEPYLARQVALLQPKLILAMGRFAVQSLLQTGEPIGRLRGRVHQYRGVPAIVTYHPAYLLRNPADKAKAWDDLCLAREVMRNASS